MKRNVVRIFQRLKSLHRRTYITLLSSFIFTVGVIFSVYFFNTQGTSYTWDGGGADNNFSTCANWSSDTCPTSSDSVVFNGTSTKDATIDVSFQGTVSSISINSGYTGTITASRSFTASGSFSQAAGTFTGTSQTLYFGGFGLSNGVFTSTSGTMSISGGLNITGGTFNHNSGTVNFVTGGYQSETYACGNVTFNLITINRSGGNQHSTIVGSDCTFPLGSSPTITPDGNGGFLVLNGTLTGSGTLSISGGLQMNTGGTLSGFSGLITGNLTNSGAVFNLSSFSPVTINGYFTLSSGTFTAPSGTMDIGRSVSVTGGTFNHNNGTVNFTTGGYSSESYSCGNIVFNLVTINRTGGNQHSTTIGSDCTFPLGNNPTVYPDGNGGSLILNGTLTGTGTLTISGGFQMNATGSLSGFSSLVASNFTNNNATFNAGSISPFTVGNFTLSSGTFTAPSGTLNVSGTFTFDDAATFNANSGTFNMSGSNQSIKCPTFNKVTFTGSGTKTLTNACVLPLGNNPSFSASLSPSSTVELTGTGTLSAFALTLSNNFSISGFTNITTTFFLGVQDTVDLSSFNTITTGSNFLMYTGSDVTAPQLLRINGHFGYESGVTFHHNNGTVEFIGSNNHTIYYSNTFYNLSILGTGSSSMVFAPGYTQTVEGTLTITGQDTNNKIVLSSGSNGNQWSIDPQGARNVSYVDVRDSNNINATAITATDSIDSGNNINWSGLTPAPVSPSDGYEASDVIGQPDFTSTNSGNLANELYLDGNGDGAAIDTVHHRLFLSDGDNCRVLEYDLDSNNNLIDHSADHVFGADTVDDSGSCDITAHNVSYPGGLAYDPTHDRLFVSDTYDNCRIMIFDTTTIEDNEDAVNYLGGGVDFNDNSCGLSQNTISYSYYGGVSYDSSSGYLYVSDGYNNSRVLVFDVNPQTITNGMNASYVLGSDVFDDTYGDCSQNHFYNDYNGLIADPIHHRLFVSDYSYDRVLVFDTSQLANNMNSSYVLGYSDFECNNQSGNQGVFSGIEGLAYDDSREILYTFDYGWSRILAFDLSEGITNGMDAIGVIGQSDFDSDASDTTQTRLYFDYVSNGAVDTVNHRLYFPDDYNYRYLVFDFVRFTTSSLTSATTGSSYSQTLETENSQGTKAFSIFSGSLPTGLTLNSSSGVISGTPTTAGTYTFTVKVTDTPGDFGSFFDKKEYTLTVAQGSTSSPVSSPKPEGEYSTTEAPTCTIEKPGSVPSLYQVDRTDGGKSMVVYFTPVTVNTQSYLLSYGTTSSAQGYSVTIDQPTDTSGAISYTIGSLTPSSTYYVMVKAQNACASSAFSSVKVSYGIGSAIDDNNSGNTDTSDSSSSERGSSFNSKDKTYKGKPYLNFYPEYLNQDATQQGVALTSEVGDIYYFALAAGKTVLDIHTISIDKIDTKNKTVTITINSTPQTTTLKAGETKTFDVDGDNKQDIQIAVDDVLAANSRQQVLIRALALDTSKNMNTDASYGLGGDQFNTNSNIISYIKNNKAFISIILILLLSLSGAWIVNKRRKENEL